YRAYKKSVINELKGGKVKSMIETRIILRAIRKKLKLGEIPGDEPSRIGGVRKLRPLVDGFKLLMMILREFFVIS
ncbi:MAG: histidinol phosphate phosphatase, partial [Candidatus Harrisonbacteria bacterium CG10_big_fil_rev_8_21_14_0_10_45_28]